MTSRHNKLPLSSRTILSTYFKSVLLSIILFCAETSFAQDSFNNPISFSYSIDCSSDYPDGLDESKASRINVVYDKKSRMSHCTITINDNIVYSGKILDKQLKSEQQLFLLENFFQGKYNAYMSITKGADYDDLKVAMIYNAQQKDDPVNNKCICLLLTDIDKTSANKNNH